MRPEGRPAHGLAEQGRISPLTLMWCRSTGLHPDGGVGPTFVTDIEVDPGHRWLGLRGAPVFGRRPPRGEICLAIDGRPVPARRHDRRRDFVLTVPLGGLAPGMHRLAVHSSTVFIPNDYLGNKDFRPLAFRLRELRLTADGEAGAGDPTADRAAA